MKIPLSKGCRTLAFQQEAEAKRRAEEEAGAAPKKGVRFSTAGLKVFVSRTERLAREAAV